MLDIREQPLSYLFLFIVMFLLIYKFRFGIYDWTLLVASIAGLILIVDQKLIIEKKIMMGYIAVGTMYVYVLISAIIQRPASIFYVLKYSRVVLSLVGTYVVLRKIASRYEIPTLEYCLGLVLLAHPLFMIAQAAIPELQSWWMNTYGFTGFYHSHRVVGFQNGHSSAGNFLGIISVYFAYISNKYESEFFLLVFVSITPLFLISSLTGGIVHVIATLYFFYSLVASRKYKYIKYMVLVGSVVLIGFAFSLTFLPNISQLLGLDDGLQRITVLFIEEQTIRDDPSESFEALLETFYLPSDTFNLIFGNLELSKTEAATTNTDSGLFASWHAFGVIGLSILLVSKLLFAYVANSRFIWTLSIIYLIVVVKNDITYSRIFFDYYFVAFLLVTFQQLRQEGIQLVLDAEQSYHD
jgi:hypothetical protein